MKNIGKCKGDELPNQENARPSAGELTDGELKAVNGGGGQIQQTLSSMVSDVIKNFGASIQNTGRA